MIPVILKGDTSGTINLALAAGYEYGDCVLTVEFNGVVRVFGNLVAGSSVGVAYTADETALFPVGAAHVNMTLTNANGTVYNLPWAKIKVTDSPAEIRTGTIEIDPATLIVDDATTGDGLGAVKTKLNAVINFLRGATNAAAFAVFALFHIACSAAEPLYTALNDMPGDAPVLTNTVDLIADAAAPVAGKIDGQDAFTRLVYGAYAESTWHEGLYNETHPEAVYTNGVISRVLFHIGDEYSCNMDSFGMDAAYSTAYPVYVFRPSGRCVISEMRESEIVSSFYVNPASMTGVPAESQLMWRAYMPRVIAPVTNFVTNLQSPAAVASIWESVRRPIDDAVYTNALLKVSLADMTNIVFRTWAFDDIDGYPTARIHFPLDSATPAVVEVYNHAGETEVQSSWADIQNLADGWTANSPTDGGYRFTTADGVNVNVAMTVYPGAIITPQRGFGGYITARQMAKNADGMNGCGYCGFVMKETATAYTTKTRPVQMQTFSTQVSDTQTAIVNAANAVRADMLMHPVSGGNYRDRWNNADLSGLGGNGVANNMLFGPVTGVATGETDSWIFGAGYVDAPGTSRNFIFDTRNAESGGRFSINPREGFAGFTVCNSNLLDIIAAHAPPPDLSAYVPKTDMSHTNGTFAAEVRAVTISPDADDAAELEGYGSFGTVGAALIALIAAVAALKRRAMTDAEADALARVYSMDTDLADCATSQDVAIVKLEQLIGETV